MEWTLKDTVFYLAIAGFVAGIFIRSFLRMGVAFSFLIFLLGVVLLLLFALHARRCSISASPREGNERATLLCAILFLAAGLGMGRYDLADRGVLRGGLESSVGQTVALEGVIVEEPDMREGTTRLVVKAESKGSAARVLLTVSHEPRYHYGDRVTASWILERPRNFTDEETLREVDYVSHLGKDDIYFEMFLPRVALLARGEGNTVIAALLAFKETFIRNIGALLPEPHASLLGGLIVGAKQSLGEKLLDDFRVVGVIHIVVLSGYNITLVARFVEWLLSRLKKHLRLTLAAVAMILFAVMVGATATVIRATVMALLVLLARGTGRIYEVTRALLLAGAVMLLHNPKILVFDASFQLSFLATVGLIYISPLIEPKLRWITMRLNFREIAVATVATQLFVLPFLLYKTGVLSLVALPVNLLILSAIPATMLFGFLAGLVGFLGSALAAPFAFISYGLLAYELAVVDWFSKLPFAAVSTPAFSLWLALFWYGVYAALFFMWRKKQFTGPAAANVLS